MEDVGAVVAAMERASGELVDDAGRTPLADVAVRARRLAGGLASRGLGRGTTLGVWLPNRREWLEAVLAAGLVGARAAGINPRYRTEELRHAIAETGMTHLVYLPSFAGSDYTAMLSELTGEDAPALVRVGDADSAGAVAFEEVVAADPIDGDARPDDLWVTFFTSGTTSRPKAVVHTQRSLVRHAVCCAQHQELAPDGAVLASLPFCGVMGFASVMEGLVAGVRTATLARFEADAAADLLVDEGVTVWNSIDEMLRRTIEVPRAAEASLHTGAVANFGPDPAALLERADAVLGGTITQPYGMSEVQALVTCPEVRAPRERHVAPGGVIVTPGTEVRVCAPDSDEVLADGEQGELQFRGTTLAAGYLRDGGQLQPLSDHGWFRTGDLGWLADGQITYLSRFKDAMRLRGYLVDPREIEDVLAAHDAIATAQVVAADRSGRTVAIAFVTATAPIDIETVRDWCAGRVADFKVPAEVRQVDTFPTTDGPHGAKVRKEVLREWAREPSTTD